VVHEDTARKIGTFMSHQRWCTRKKIVVLTPQNVKIDTQKVDGKIKKNYIKLRVPIIDSLCQTF